MIESAMQLETWTGVGILEQALFVEEGREGGGEAGFYKNRHLTRKLESLSFLTTIWLAIPNFENIILEFWNTCTQRVQIVVKISAWGDGAPCAPTAAKWVAWIKKFYQNYNIF